MLVDGAGAEREVLDPDSGSVTLDGDDLRTGRTRSRLGSVPEEDIPSPTGTICDNAGERCGATSGW